MSPWRQKAVELFPELVTRFEDADTPYLLWFQLLDAFVRAYEQTPRDESLIRRIYQYSDWCCDQPQGETAADDLVTCVAVCFYEEIPPIPKAREDMPRWWLPGDLAGERSVFSYHLTPEQFEELKRFLSQEIQRYDSTLRACLPENSPTIRTRATPP
jgi:hypothetical protein